ncbi:hypothetical protein BJ322DRAFT_1208320 [Thelephora terrestris]|uniref:Uncharacterized protein n=1 Tax=Thelephora terrestris TaxID=56493 RepID=A0A9P6HN23_9AGAM|nr:hypothetical protein BJ322DRAFT_1208320 [Thelephora terrestris]
MAKAEADPSTSELGTVIKQNPAAGSNPYQLVPLLTMATVTQPVDNSQSEPALTPQETEAIKDKARWLRRVANPFADFYVIVAIGAAGSPTVTEAARRHGDKQTRTHAKDLTPTQLQVYVEDFDEIIYHLPFLKHRLESDVPSKFIRKTLNYVQSLASQARQTDTKTIKQSTVSLIPQKYFPHGADSNAAVNPHEFIKVLNPGATKSWRGWGNIVTARLLCPIDNLSEFIADPERQARPPSSTRAKLRDGKIKLIDSAGDPKLPAFLYDENMTDGSLAQGLFRGPLLLAVYTHIFIAPSAATLGAKVSLKPGNAKIHGMMKVLPPTICYAAIQAYITLCCSKEWKEQWKGIQFPRLYILLREQFAHSDDPWRAETLKWWDEKIFGGAPDTDEELQEEERETQGPSMRSRMENERLARIQAASQAAAFWHPARTFRADRAGYMWIPVSVALQRRASPVPFPFPGNTNNSGDVPPLPHAGDDGEIPPFVDADNDHEIPPLEHTDDRDNGDTPLLVSESH